MSRFTNCIIKLKFQAIYELIKTNGSGRLYGSVNVRCNICSDFIINFYMLNIWQRGLFFLKNIVLMDTFNDNLILIPLSKCVFNARRCA